MNEVLAGRFAAGFPELPKRATLELLSLFMLTPKTDAILFLTVVVPYDLARRLWPAKVAESQPQSVAAIEWKFPVIERRKQRR